MRCNPPRRSYAREEAATISAWVTARSPEYGEALRFILSSGARIDETLHFCTDKIFSDEKRVELISKSGLWR
jgi:hypothetical protein